MHGKDRDLILFPYLWGYVWKVVLKSCWCQTMMVVVVGPRCLPLVGSVLWTGKEWGSEVGVAVWFVLSWCSQFVVARCYVWLPRAKAHTTALLSSVSRHCQSKFGSLSRHDSGGHTSSSTRVAFRIGARSRVDPSHPSLRNGHKKGVG